MSLRGEFTKDDYNIYRDTYKEFIEGILNSRQNKKFKYSECHHIIPECLGGTWDDGWVYLTFQEHFLAHKILSENNPDNYQLLCAYWFMSTREGICTPEEYEHIRTNYIDAPIPEDTRIRMSIATKSNWSSPEYRDMMVHIARSDSRNRKLSNSLKLYYSEDSNREKTSLSTSRGLLKYYEDPKNIDKHRIAAKISNNRPEIRKKISDNTREALMEDSVRKKSSLARKGTRWMNNGVHSIRVKDSLKIEEYLSIGYTYGRISNSSN